MYKNNNNNKSWKTYSNKYLRFKYLYLDVICIYI